MHIQGTNAARDLERGAWLQHRRDVRWGWLCWLALLCLSACAEDADTAEERGVRDSSEVQALRASRVSASQALPFEHAVEVTLTKHDPTALFSLALSAAAHVELHAIGPAGALGRGPVLSIFPVESAHDEPRGRSSARSSGRDVVLRAALPAGQYVVSVHGSAHVVRGRVVLSAVCTGAGCPDVTPSCLFGESFSERDMQPGLQVTGEQWLRSAAELEGDVARAQVVAALQQSSHTDVSSAEQAFAAADQSELRRVQFTAVRTGVQYVAWEYGAGDNSYGAYFRAGERSVLAAIHDGDIIACTVSP